MLVPGSGLVPGLFGRHADAFPREWTAHLVNEWLGDLRAVRALKRSTLRNHQCVSSDYRTRTLRRALDDTLSAALTPDQERKGTMKRQVSYQWRLRETMAVHGMFNTSDLAPLLADRGIKLSSVQVWRLVTQPPERLSMPVLAALCDIFDCTPDKLIATKAENVATRRTASSGGPPNVVDIAALRATRARIPPEQ